MIGVAGGFVEDVEFARSNVSFHLAVPEVICPTAEIGNKSCAVFEGELLDGALDFLHCAHWLKLLGFCSRGKRDLIPGGRSTAERGVGKGPGRFGGKCFFAG